MPIKWSRDEGLGAVPNQQTVDYFGFTVEMEPREFLALAGRAESRWPHSSSVEQEVSGLFNAVRKGAALGPPFLSVRWYPNAKVWGVIEFEGRKRAEVAREMGEADIPVDIFPRDGIRARHLTAEMCQAPIVKRGEAEELEAKSKLADEIDATMESVRRLTV